MAHWAGSVSFDTIVSSLPVSCAFVPVTLFTVRKNSVKFASPEFFAIENNVYGAEQRRPLPLALWSEHSSILNFVSAASTHTAVGSPRATRARNS